MPNGMDINIPIQLGIPFYVWITTNVCLKLPLSSAFVTLILCSVDFH